MDSKKLNAFLLIVKYKNFSRAAEQLNYTPSALSHIADSLEAELGVKLFNRTRKGVEITPEGELLCKKFLSLKKAETDLFETANKLSAQNQKTLKIGTYSSIALQVLPKLIKEFKQIMPNVKIEILVDDYLQECLDEKRADIVFGVKEAVKENFVALFEDEFVAAVPQNTFLNKDTAFLKDLYKYPFICPAEPFLDSYLNYNNFSEVIPLNSVENDSALYMVRENLGVTILPRLSTGNCPAGVKILKLEPSLSRTIGIAYNKKTALAPCKEFANTAIKFYK